MDSSRVKGMKKYLESLSALANIAQEKTKRGSRSSQRRGRLIKDSRGMQKHFFTSAPPLFLSFSVLQHFINFLKIISLFLFF
jgi:hypothetical protein